MLRAKFSQQTQIIVGRWVQYSENQGNAVLADGNFDLRQSRANGEVFDEPAERLDQIIDRLGDHLATPHIGDIGCVPLAKPHEDPALAGHILDPESGTATIVPVRADDRLQPLSRLKLGIALQIVSQGPEFYLALCFDADVLQHTAAAAAVGLAARIHTIR
ncbi:MAG: hypothetical protein IIB77_09015 [Proteobacteria bacterium]|nr:hypothetical protein [Pseudomonadota bacterium]